MKPGAVTPVRRALLAPYDKAGLASFATALAARGVELVASGGTARVLADAGLTVTPVEEVTGSPEMLGGRVKTLHPAIHGGLLADRRNAEHVRQLHELGIEPFDLLVAGLYPFRQTVAAGAAHDAVIEQIDIGGPAMVRAAAKNFESVGVVVDPGRYDAVIDELDREGGLTRATREELAAAAFAHTAAYDAAVASWFAEQRAIEELPAYVGLAYEKIGDLRYGENPHQHGALYREAAGAGPLGGAQVLQGKDMSFNNWLDTIAAYELVAAMPHGSAVIVKHNNPCGAAAKGSLADSYRAAFESDEVSAFGGIVAFHGDAGAEAATAMADVFTEVVIAPSFTPAARAAFAARTNLRVVEAPLPDGRGLDVRPMPGGALVQDRRSRNGDASSMGGRLQPRAFLRGMGRSRARVDDRLAGQVEHDRARTRRCDGGRGCGADVEGGLVVDRGSEGRGPGEGRGHRERRVLPVPRRARGGRRCRMHGGHPPGWIEGRRRRASRRRHARHGRRDDRDAPLPSLNGLGRASDARVGFAP